MESLGRLDSQALFLYNLCHQNNPLQKKMGGGGGLKHLFKSYVLTYINKYMHIYKQIIEPFLFEICYKQKLILPTFLHISHKYILNICELWNFFFRTPLVIHVEEKSLKAICRDGRTMALSYEAQELRYLLMCQVCIYYLIMFSYELVITQDWNIKRNMYLDRCIIWTNLHSLKKKGGGRAFIKILSRVLA